MSLFEVTGEVGAEGHLTARHQPGRRNYLQVAAPVDVEATPSDAVPTGTQ
jgi:hypothetical protein